MFFYVQGDFLTPTPPCYLFRAKMKKGQPEALLDEGFNGRVALVG